MVFAEDIIRRKTRVFSEEEVLDKLIEELEEALEAAVQYGQLHTEESLDHLMEELADVDIAGQQTFRQMRESCNTSFNRKIVHGIFHQMKKAVEQRELQLANMVGDADA